MPNRVHVVTDALEAFTALAASSPSGTSPSPSRTPPPSGREAERLHGPDPLGYYTERDFMEVAREMAEDALSGRNREAVEAELKRFCSRRRKKDR